MEQNKQMGSSSSSSSFTSELFGSKESPLSSSSSSGIFSSIFSPPSPKVLGRESLRAELSGKTSSGAWSSKIGIQGDISKRNDGETHNTTFKDMSSIYQEQRVQQPCNLSSSIYYGGQDIYPHLQSAQNAGLSYVQKNDGVEDDSESASRGNWWQGSLYY